MLDPFHPDCQGVRVPTRIGRATATYSAFSDFTLPQDTLAVINFGLPSHSDVCMTSDAQLISEITANVPVLTRYRNPLGDEVRQAYYIPVTPEPFDSFDQKW